MAAAGRSTRNGRVRRRAAFTPRVSRACIGCRNSCLRAFELGCQGASLQVWRTASRGSQLVVRQRSRPASRDDMRQLPQGSCTLPYGSKWKIMFVYRCSVGRRSSTPCEPQAKIGLFTGIIRRAALSTNSRSRAGNGAYVTACQENAIRSNALRAGAGLRSLRPSSCSVFAARFPTIRRG